MTTLRKLAMGGFNCITLSIFLTVAQPSLASVKQCRELLSAFLSGAKTKKLNTELNQIQNYIEQNAFTCDRNLKEYFLALPSLEASLTNMRTNGVWLDLGAGNAKALREYLAHTQQTQLQKQKLIAVGVKIPRFCESDIEMIQQNNRFTYIESTAETVDFADLPFLDIVTDVLGALSYSPRPDIVLQSVLSRLNSGGEMHIAYQPMKFKVKTGWLRTIDLKDYVGMIQGIQVVETLEPLGHYASIHLRRTDGILTVPQLQLVSAIDGAPPSWTYELVQ